MRKIGSRIARAVCAASIIWCVTGDGARAQVQTVVVFEETLQKNETGTLEETRSFTANAGLVTISFTNGSAGNFDIVRNGRIEVNGQGLFTTNDFKVAGTISRTIIVDAGLHTLVISLGGPAGGQATVKVTQEQETRLQFPARTIFVSGSSPFAVDDLSCGLGPLTGPLGHPCLTINMGLNKARAIGGPQVVVGSGIYTENVTLAAGVSLLGGYDAEFTRRDLTVFKPILRGRPSSGPSGASATVSAISIQTPTVFEGFIVLAPPAVIPGSNSIGVYVRNSSDALTIQNNIILGGVGAGGTMGAPGADGLSGTDGADGVHATSFSSSGLAVANNGGAGGPGGGLAGGGGAGGSAFAPIYDQQQQSGSPAPVGGSGGFDGKADVVSGLCVGVPPTLGSPNGGPGASGANGEHGAAGAGGIGGAFVSGTWISNAGTSGGPGQNGAGGAGGGAAGGLQGLQSCNGPLAGSQKVGASGGGGGGGASRGQGGGGGAGGGSSFGILVVGDPGAARPRIGANEIQLGIGGHGGHGGSGGLTATGGAGGIGGAAAIVENLGAVSGVAGNGGKGGNSGNGGGGGGGAGGNAVGIMANFDGVPYAIDNVVVTDTGRAGDGGIGGRSFGNSGANGNSGVIAAVRLIP
jgi:hypothetical protein